MAPTSIDGTDIVDATIDGTSVSQITVDGDVVFDTGPTPPDSQDLQANYDWSASGTTTTTVPDQTGNGFDLTGSFTSLATSINGVQAGDFDGSDDSLDVDFSAISQPTTIAAVCQADDAGNAQRYFDGNGEFHSIEYDFRQGRSRLAVNSGELLSPADGTGTTNPQVNVVLMNGTSSVIRVNGSQVASGDVGTSGLSGVTVGRRQDKQSRFYDGRIGQILVYKGDKSSVFGEIESFLGDKFGITV